MTHDDPMLIHRGFRYRVYPTDVQIGLLTRWDQSFRWLWNNAHAERIAKWEHGY